MLFQRKIIEKLRLGLEFPKKILILYGPRQVGKTTLLQHLLPETSAENSYFNCELLSVKRQLEKEDPYAAVSFFGDASVIVLDEAQKIQNIGFILKQIIDTFPEIKIIATGSSSFDLASETNEPLTGRAIEYRLYPLSVLELEAEWGRVQTLEQLESFLVYGMYPDVVLASQPNKEILLNQIASQYLYQDVLAFERLKKPELLLKLLELLALQLGQEVSIHELALNLQVSRATIERYLDLLEKSFVIFRLRAFASNQRGEVVKKRKIYFWDNGIRNAILNAFQPIRLRNDIGALWENFLISERQKSLSFQGRQLKTYFWRSHSQKEVDYLEERNGQMWAYEFKWKARHSKVPVEFSQSYPKVAFEEVHAENFLSFLKKEIE